ncbi:MAG TPA: NFACT family protein [Pyrinomonadaceae bacterium]|jgi:predicted ribosome quality control (RQC) complex YloA/Tae2 family protein
MNQETLKQIVAELNELLPGRFVGRVFQLSSLSLAIDFGLKDRGYLFLSVEPAQPRLYLIKRSTRELEKASVPPSPFVQILRSTLGGGSLVSLKEDNTERVVRFSFAVTNDLGETASRILVAQLTGRSANVFLLDASEEILQAWRHPHGAGQQPGEIYRPPKAQTKRAAANTISTADVSSGSETLSEALDKHYRDLAVEHEFDTLAASLLARLKKEITRRTKLQANLQNDLAAHGNPEEHKRLGDLLLANISNAERAGSKVRLKDYFADNSPTIEVEIDENISLADAAGQSFARYTKAKRAVAEIGTRLAQLDRELSELSRKRERLVAAIASRDPQALAEFEETKTRPAAVGKKQKAPTAFPGMRRYQTSDGYEVLVGRTARDNDQLTFRVARPNDLWFHAADYPGSHVIVRNATRKEIPQRTIIEAAQLAAKFSQAGDDSKVTIHYTPRKFLNKPRGAAPGLVRMSSFKTINVKPGENIERMK